MWDCSPLILFSLKLNKNISVCFYQIQFTGCGSFLFPFCIIVVGIGIRITRPGHLQARVVQVQLVLQLPVSNSTLPILTICSVIHWKLYLRLTTWLPERDMIYNITMQLPSHAETINVLV